MEVTIFFRIVAQFYLLHIPRIICYNNSQKRFTPIKGGSYDPGTGQSPN